MFVRLIFKWISFACYFGTANGVSRVELNGDSSEIVLDSGGSGPFVINKDLMTSLKDRISSHDTLHTQVQAIDTKVQAMDTTVQAIDTELRNTGLNAMPNTGGILTKSLIAGRGGFISGTIACPTDRTAATLYFLVGKYPKIAFNLNIAIVGRSNSPSTNFKYFQQSIIATTYCEGDGDGAKYIDMGPQYGTNMLSGSVFRKYAHVYDSNYNVNSGSNQNHYLAIGIPLHNFGYTHEVLFCFLFHSPLFASHVRFLSGFFQI